jgi:hypothetical protein
MRDEHYSDGKNWDLLVDCGGFVNLTQLFVSKPTAQDVSTINALGFTDELDKISGHRWHLLNVVYSLVSAH